ncbi:MAG: hypothetical protein U0T56_02555 [Ferruginibacter sp.]
MRSRKKLPRREMTSRRIKPDVAIITDDDDSTTPMISKNIEGDCSGKVLLFAGWTGGSQ